MTESGWAASFGIDLIIMASAVGVDLAVGAAAVERLAPAICPLPRAATAGTVIYVGRAAAPATMLLREGGAHEVATASHLAELEIEGTDVVAAWNALDPVVAQCAGLLGTPATKSDYHVGHSDDPGTVAGADLRDCLDRVESPTLISVTYTASSNSGSDPHSIELRIMRYRRFRELNVHIRVSGPADVRTLGFFERTKRTLADAIDRLNQP